jgi:hypothetical protein
MRGDIPPLPQYVFMVWSFVKHRDNFALGYGLYDRGFESWKGAANFPLHHRVQTGSRVHPTSYLKGIGGSFRVDKAAGA